MSDESSTDIVPETPQIINYSFYSSMEKRTHQTVNQYFDSILALTSAVTLTGAFFGISTALGIDLHKVVNGQSINLGLDGLERSLVTLGLVGLLDLTTMVISYYRFPKRRDALEIIYQAQDIGVDIRCLEKRLVSGKKLAFMYWLRNASKDISFREN